MAASEAQLGKATYNGMIFEVATKKDTKKHGIHGMFLTIPSHKKSPSSETTMAISGCSAESPAKDWQVRQGPSPKSVMFRGNPNGHLMLCL